VQGKQLKPKIRPASMPPFQARTSARADESRKRMRQTQVQARRHTPRLADGTGAGGTPSEGAVGAAGRQSRRNPGPTPWHRPRRRHRGWWRRNFPRTLHTTLPRLGVTVQWGIAGRAACGPPARSSPAAAPSILPRTDSFAAGSIAALDKLSTPPREPPGALRPRRAAMPPA
jgi:hypothetical protein